MLGGLFALLQTFDTSFNALCGHLLGWALPVWAMPWRMCVRENARRIKAHRDTKVIRLLKASDAMVFEWALHFGVYIFVFAFLFFFFFFFSNFIIFFYFFLNLFSLNLVA